MKSVWFLLSILFYSEGSLAMDKNIVKKEIDALENNSPTDFDFEIGEWFVKHKKLKNFFDSSNDWIAFEGFSSTKKVLGGFGNVEENILRLPSHTYRAVAIRTYDLKTREWSIWWLDGRFPGVLDKPVVGTFKGKIGTFYGEDILQNRPTKVRFIWDARDINKPRWEQAFSFDNGVTWQTNWVMEFTKGESLKSE